MTTIPAMKKVIPDKVEEYGTSKGKMLMNEDEQLEGHKRRVSIWRKAKNSSN